MIHLLSCGPSLSLYRGDPGLRIAINRAIDKVEWCDWWATGELADPATWGQYLRRNPAPRIGIATCAENIHFVDPLLLAADLDGHWPIESRRRFTAPLALAWALATWQDEDVHCWGFDMAGNGYAGGGQMYQPRRSTGDMDLDRIREERMVEDRWTVERAAFAALYERHRQRVYRHV